MATWDPSPQALGGGNGEMGTLGIALFNILIRVGGGISSKPFV